MEIKRENPASRQTRIAAFVRKNTVLLIALALAVLSIALVPPDEAYAGYYDLKTLCCLFGTLAVVCALKNIHFFSILAQRIIVLTGSERTAALALAQAGCRVTVCARTPEKAAALAARCGGVTVSWEDLPRAAAEHGLLLNATPLGMEGSPEFESLDFVQALPTKAVVYDLVYHPTDTALMRAAEHRGLKAVGGLALLVQQAALSFAHFTGMVPDAALCRDILQELEAAQ